MKKAPPKMKKQKKKNKKKNRSSKLPPKELDKIKNENEKYKTIDQKNTYIYIFKKD